MNRYDNNAAKFTKAHLDEGLGFKVAGAKGEDGFLEGYLAVFGNVDDMGEKIVEGAFAKTLDRVRKGQVPLMARHFAHGGDLGESIGIISSAHEDGKGLFIHADFFGDPESQKVREKIAEAKAKGMKISMSVGYNVLRYEPVADGEKSWMELKELRLLEGTVTMKPVNAKAVVARMKSGDGEGDPAYEELLTRIGNIEEAVGIESAEGSEGAGGKANTITPDPAFTIEQDAQLRQTELEIIQLEESVL